MLHQTAGVGLHVLRTGDAMMEDSSISSLVLLLMVCVCELPERTEAFPPGGGAEDTGSRIRGLWRLHMKEMQSKGKGERRWRNT